MSHLLTSHCKNCNKQTVDYYKINNDNPNNKCYCKSCNKLKKTNE